MFKDLAAGDGSIFFFRFVLWTELYNMKLVIYPFAMWYIYEFVEQDLVITIYNEIAFWRGS